MKVVVAKHVYARIGSPSTKEQFAYYREPGEALSIVSIIQGTMIDGNSIWYHCEDDGFFYWSGGFEFTQNVLEQPTNFEHKEDRWYIYQSAANELLSKFRYIPGFAGLAAGYKTLGEQITENISLILYVNSKTEIQNPQVPKFVNYRGFKLITDVQILGKVELLRDDPDSELPYLMGGSIACVKDGKQVASGTRSLIVKKGNKTYLLASYHVACANLFEISIKKFIENGAEIIFPSLKYYYTEIIKSKVIEGEFGTNIDYALIETDIIKFANYIPNKYFTGFYHLSDLKKLVDGTRLFKYGVTTKFSSGSVITAYPVNDITVDDDLNIMMSGLIECDLPSENGDSGGPVIDEDGKIIGFIVASTKVGANPKRTYILPVGHLLHSYHIEPYL